jgi:hypothetical protein
MVRSIDAQAPLQRADFLYLRDRNRLPRGYTIDDGDDSFTEEEREYAARDAKEHDAIARKQAKAFGRASAPSPQNDGEGDDPPEPEDEEEDEEEAEGYDAWSLDELKDELRERDLAVGGKKAELVARLEADDAEED